MAEDTVELTPQQREEREREWRQYYESRTPITPGIIEAIKEHIFAGQRPPRIQQEGRVSSQTEDRLRSGRGIVDFLPEGLRAEPDVARNRKYTEIEEHILRINNDAKLGGDYLKPPGEEVKRVDKNIDLNMTLKIDWAAYGWAEDEKRAAGALLTQKFGLHGKQRERAAEVLLLAGYTAKDAIAKLNGKKEASLGPEKYAYFEDLFSDNENPLPKSSLKMVFNEEMHNDERVFTKDPENMEDLAWQMSWTGDAGGLAGRWMLESDNPILEIRMKTKEERDKRMRETNGRDKSWGKYFVNEHNFIEWFRQQTNRLYDIHGPNGPINVLDDVKMSKGGFYQMTFRQMIEKGPLFFSEDEKTKYTQTWLQLQWEENMFSTLYTNDVNYRQASGLGVEKWVEQYEQMTLMNPLTKTGFRTNMFQRLLTGSLEYKEGRGDIYDKKYLSDNKLGGAFVEMALAFYNLGDFNELQRVLGKDSMYFTREGWEEIIKFVAEDTKTRPGGAVTMAPESAKAFEKAFGGGSNTVTDQQAFIEFLNLNTTNLPGGYQDLLVSRGMRLAVARRYGIDEEAAGMGLTEAQAWFFTRFMGGMARNDLGVSDKGPNPSVHDKMSELMNMDANRMKYAQGEGKPYGTHQTIGKHLTAAVPPMIAMVTQQEVYVRNADGTPIDRNGKPCEVDKDGNPVASANPLMMRKSILQILEDLHTLRVKQDERVKILNKQLAERGLDKESDEYKTLADQIEEVEKSQNRRYQDIVGRDVTFRENAHREYVQVHLKPGYTWMKRVMNGEGLKLEEFNAYDSFGGVRFKREEFIKRVQGDLVGTVRDMFKKYQWMNFNEDIRAPFFNPVTKQQEFRNCKLGMTVFGYDVLNREEFWKRDKNGKPIKHYGLAEIDFNKVQADKMLAAKQVMLTEIAGDLYNHQLMNSTDIRFNQAYYLNVVDALKSISGKLLVDQFAKHGITVTEDFFNEKDIKWLKDRALNGNVLGLDLGIFGFHLKWWITSLWDKTDKEGLGIGKMLGIIMKESLTLAA